MSRLNVAETEIVKSVALEIADDVRSFDFANAPDDDIVEFIGYAYIAICDRLRERYKHEVPF